ncbi:MAG TPA: SdpI family protein, partial [Candidatus Eisenbacteria bacterium]
QVDGWGGKGSGLLMLPIIALVCYVIMALVPRIDPARANFASFAGPFNLFRLVFLLFMAGLYAAMHATFRGAQLNMTSVVLPMLGLLFMVVGWMMGHIRPNWTVGIRTPWTLSSRLAWDRSHRLGSKLFMAAGPVFVLAGIVGKPWAFGAAMCVMLAVVLVTVGYSYVVWKNDPDREPPIVGRR